MSAWQRLETRKSAYKVEKALEVITSAQPEVDYYYHWTAYGLRFMQACYGPRRSSSE